MSAPTAPLWTPNLGIDGTMHSPSVNSGVWLPLFKGILLNPSFLAQRSWCVVSQEAARTPTAAEGLVGKEKLKEAPQWQILAPEIFYLSLDMGRLGATC